MENQPKNPEFMINPENFHPWTEPMEILTPRTAQK